MLRFYAYLVVWKDFVVWHLSEAYILSVTELERFKKCINQITKPLILISIKIEIKILSISSMAQPERSLCYVLRACHHQPPQLSFKSLKC